MRSRKHISPDRVIIFGRYPVPGRTKTRLIPALGRAGAADLQRRLTERTLKTVRRFSSGRDTGVEFCFEGGSANRVCRWLGPDLILSKQAAGDLGERMSLAFLNAFQSGCRRVVLMGTDIPGFRSDYLGQAFDALTKKDLVLAASTDGGYWLIGLNRPIDLFKGIKWGTRTVLDHTIALAKEKGLKVRRLDPLTDIDTIDDLEEWSPDEMNQRPYISTILPVVNEGSNIEAAICSARDVDAEVIVVDGGSIDDTIERATGSGARIETGPRGRAKQQNLGAAVARGRVLLFLHADTRLPGGYVSHVFETLMDSKTVAGAFRFKTDLDHPIMTILEFLVNVRSRTLNLPYGDQGLFIRKAVFDSVGGFPEVPIAEDLFLMRRLSEKGRIRIAPAEAVTSARLWRKSGLLRTTLINQIIVAGCFFGISPRLLAALYRVPRSK